jgi:hypothetical protein
MQQPDIYRRLSASSTTAVFQNTWPVRSCMNRSPIPLVLSKQPKRSEGCWQPRHDESQARPRLGPLDQSLSTWYIHFVPRVNRLCLCHRFANFQGFYRIAVGWGYFWCRGGIEMAGRWRGGHKIVINRSMRDHSCCVNIEISALGSWLHSSEVADDSLCSVTSKSTR